jgi:triphosphoribosyl-dephospho-CoA synthase
MTRPGRVWDPLEIAALAQLACALEAAAPKPGNVSPGRAFRDTSYEDFLVSAAALAPSLARAGDRGLGATILSCVEATSARIRRNTNLGIVLLLAPLARAALTAGPAPLRERLAAVLRSTTVQDARDTYAAIRLAAPGGLGHSEAQDVDDVPTVTLREAMQLAESRDAIAREYVTDYGITFGIGVPALSAARAAGLDWTDATVETGLTILAAVPDTLIARKHGRSAAEEVSAGAGRVLEAGGVRSGRGREALSVFDATLRNTQNSRNPGTTADLTAAALFVHLLETSGA